jgi:hypothetical protein
MGLPIEDCAVVYEGKLTKSLLMGLDEWHHISSNRQPGIYELVAPLAERNQQWEKIKKMGVYGSKCYVRHVRKPKDISQTLPLTIFGTFTKAFFIQLDEWHEVWITSGPAKNLKERIIPQDREGQWKRFEAAGADGHKCKVTDIAILSTK